VFYEQRLQADVLMDQFRALRGGAYACWVAGGLELAGIYIRGDKLKRKQRGVL